MEDEFEGELKHSKVDRRRRQFEDKSRFGRVGATRKKVGNVDTQVELEIRRPNDEDFLILTTAVDAEWELPFHHAHGLTSEQIVEFESDLSSRYPADESTDSYGRRVTRFRVPGSTWAEGRDTAAKQKARRD